MVRYRYTGTELPYTANTTGGAVASIANNGFTRITSTVAERYVLAPPVAGVRKTIMVDASGTTGRVTIELSTVSSGDAVTAIGSTGDGTVTEIFVETTSAYVIEMVGLSTAQWKILYNTTGIPTAASTGIVFQAS